MGKLMKWVLGILTSLLLMVIGWACTEFYTMSKDNVSAKVERKTITDTVNTLVTKVETLTEKNGALLLKLEKSKLENIQLFITMTQAMKPTYMPYTPTVSVKPYSPVKPPATWEVSEPEALFKLPEPEPVAPVIKKDPVVITKPKLDINKLRSMEMQQRKLVESLDK
jgi:hypothetical protein